ncbi:MAG: CidA/LrgA family protein, partial [Bacilli bacterium]
ILIAFQLLGIMLQSTLNLPLPSNVVGLLLFIIALFLRIVRISWVEASAQILLKHMMLFFAPFIVGSMVIFPLFRSELVAVIAGLFLSTFAVLYVTGWMMNRLTEEQVVDNDVE